MPFFCCAGGKPFCICLGDVYQWSNCCVAVCQRHAVCKVGATTDSLLLRIAACLWDMPLIILLWLQVETTHVYSGNNGRAWRPQLIE